MKKIIVIFLTFITLSAVAQKKALTLNDAVLSYSNGLMPNTLFSLQGVDGTNNYVVRKGKTYFIKDANQQEIATITLKEIQKINKDLKRLPRLLRIDSETITFRNKNSIVIYNYKNKTIQQQIEFDKNAQNVDFSSDAIAYTLDNNLFIATKNNSKIAITNFADKNIVSGQAIARYEFGISKGTFWSPNNKYLAFYQKDETNVTDYPLVDITTYPAMLNNIKYPMAGQGSELAKIGIYNIKNNKLIYLDIDTKDEHYLTNLSWSADGKCVLVAEVNRAQNHFTMNLYAVNSGKKIRTLFEESNERWVEPENDAVFLPNDAKKFIWMSERDGFKNLFLYNIKGKLLKKLTKFKFPITSFLGFDKSGGNVMVTATGEDGKQNHVYKINIETNTVTKLTSKKGTHKAQLNGDYIIDKFSSLTVPREIRLININDGTKTLIFNAEDPLKTYKTGEITFGTLKSSDGFDLYTRMIKPANFDANKKYPVLIYVYGGTHAQLITNSWQGGASLWMQSFANQHNYIVFTLDNRGSENRGFAFESVIHRKAGDAAIEDQLIGVDYLKSLPFIDADRIAVHGWSYGGFMASSLILRNPKVFTTAVAGGPVTDWKYYEVMYGERYMDTPQENPEGYAKARVGKYLDGFKGKLLLIHGSVDPTVVPQHSMTLLQEAVKKGVQLDFFTYPMHPHNVRGKDRVHLMQKVLDYVLENNK